MSKLKRTLTFAIAVAVVGLATAVAVLSPGAQEPRRTARADTADEKRWEAVAPGRVEPWSGEIKVSASAIGRITEVLVKTNDKVFTGELMIRLDDDEARARVLAAEAQVALRKRARNDQTAARRSTERRKNEDAVADAERAIA